MERLLYTALFSICLSGLVSGWVTYINLGAVENFIQYWGTAYLNAWPVAFITAYLLAIPIKAITQKIIKVIS